MKNPEIEPPKRKAKAKKADRKSIAPMYELKDLIPDAIPDYWIWIPDITSLELVLSRYEPTVLIGYRGTTLENFKPTPIYSEITVQMHPNGSLSEWQFDSRNNRWVRKDYKDMKTFLTNSIIGMWLFFGKRSVIYYDPKISPLDDESRESAVPVPSHDLRIIHTPKKNPKGSIMDKLPGIKNLRILRERNLTQNYGGVYLARVYGTQKGVYAVWADASNTMASSDSEFYKKYGYPAKYDLKFHPTYFLAMEDYLTRDDLNIPVPLRGG